MFPLIMLLCEVLRCLPPLHLQGPHPDQLGQQESQPLPRPCPPLQYYTQHTKVF